MEETDQKTDSVDNAVAAGGAYQVIQDRLQQQGERLVGLAQQLNTQRADEFGATDMHIAARTRVRTENNCVGRDIVQVGNLLVFGYNVFIGLKNTTQVADVFEVYEFSRDGDAYALKPQALETSFLSDKRFRADFDELYRYYKDTRLLQLVHRDGKLLASFQIGERLEDIRVFRWSVAADGQTLTYIDNRGERDIELPNPYDFEWTETTRDDITHGRSPHINVLDTVFVEIADGYLTIKLENNTERGAAAATEPVEESNQSLDDCAVSFAEVGNLVLLSVLPYKEPKTRYFVYNSFTKTVTRIDAIGESCVQLPEDHGIIFPGGYYLSTGKSRSFSEQNTEGLRFKRKIRSPNGEDVLYVFYEPSEGVVALLSYNLISKALQNPIVGHGYALAQDGSIIVFNADHEATRIHPMQIWVTPYVSEEFASRQPIGESYLAKIGNAELVRGVSDIYSITNLIKDSAASLAHYEALRAAASQLFDSHYWVDDDEALGIGTTVREITETVELVIDEFEKVEAIRRQSTEALQDAEETQQTILNELQPDTWRSIEAFINALDAMRKHRGHLQTIRELRYIDVDRIDALDEVLIEQGDALSAKAATFLTGEAALQPYRDRLDTVSSALADAKTVAMLKPLLEELDAVATSLDLLSEMAAGLKVDDASVQTEIVESISTVYSGLNQTRARARQARDGLGQAEHTAQFNSQFRLFGQTVVNALDLATTPEKCEDQLTRLLVQLEEFESQFSQSETFLAEIMQKREEVYESFEARKQDLIDQRQARAQTIADALDRMLQNVDRRTKRFDTQDALNTYLASDSLVLKIRDMITDLRALDSAVKADDAEARLNMLKDQAIRSLRDRSDLYHDGGNTIQLGPRHRFSVSREELNLTIIPRDGDLCLHLIGTQYFEQIHDEALDRLRDYWTVRNEAETETIYRAEYLAYRIIEAAEKGDALDWSTLSRANGTEKLNEIVQSYAAGRYRDDYQKGVHDVDAARILGVVVDMLDKSDVLRYSPTTRAYAQLFWASYSENPASQRRIEESQAAQAMSEHFGDTEAMALVTARLQESVATFFGDQVSEVDELMRQRVSRYLAAELAREKLQFVSSAPSKALMRAFKASIKGELQRQFDSALSALEGDVIAQFSLAKTWLHALLKSQDDSEHQDYVSEVAAELVTSKRLARRSLKAAANQSIEGLFGEHPRIDGGQLTVQLDEFLERLGHHTGVFVPEYREYLTRRQEILDATREEMRLDEFKPRPLSSFVRNKLINDAYLPLIGDNLAKQIGTAGESKRSDLSGLLMMISPPGYGKTTLMEYVAARLGLTFVKVNGPALGHEVDSLDPETAPDSAARSELTKLNLAFEMGDNVMLYIDDIQHTNPAFLQKFIPLCDSTRRVEGVWRGKTRTYDMRGRKFCVVMAGNPYTESGEVFQVPDMLANRADIYNLGDVLSGKQAQFELSYIENSLTSNPVLAPLATRDTADVYRFVDMAKGREVSTSEFSHSYSAAEVNEITKTLERLFDIQAVILSVNQQYIESAAQDDRYRVEPKFLLQGSYRNMNKLAEKVSAIMNNDELDALIDDHYRGEAQLLTQGTEANLLKLGELRDTLDDVQTKRWAEIKKDYVRNRKMGGDEQDVGNRITAQLADLVEHVGSLGETLQPNGVLSAMQEHQAVSSRTLQEALTALQQSAENRETVVNVTTTPSPEFGQILSALNNTIENTLFPLVRSMDKRIAQDLEAHDKLNSLSAQVERLREQLD
ncbi:MAG: DNA repair ATPase [Pseudomonadota bacterium]